MKVAARVDYSGILAMARELAKYSPLPYAQIARMETASIVKIAALRAKIASVAAIKRHVANYESDRIVTATGAMLHINNNKKFKGRTWLALAYNPGIDAALGRGATRGSGRAGIRNVGALMVFDTGGTRGWHLQDFAWQAYQLAIGELKGYAKARIKELVARRGLMRLSWLQIGDSLGVPLSSVSPNGNLQEGIARAARGPRGRTYRNGTSYVTTTSTALTIRVRNVSPLAIKNRGQEQLDRAMAQRLKGFQIAMRKGMLTDLKARSARWRGVFVTG